MLGPYELNKIYNEDSYKAVKKIPDKSIDLIYTDIPYLYKQGGEGNSELGKRAMKKKKSLIDLNIQDGIDFAILSDFVRVMKKINIFIWCSKLQVNEIMNFFLQKNSNGKEKFNINYEILIWGKTNPQPTTNNTWLPDLEYCLYFREKGVKLNDGYELKTKFDITPINKRDKDLYKHPTIKPLSMVERHIMHTTQVGDIVADFFSGSGTTAVACKETKRKYLAFEISEKHYKISIDRMNGINAHGQTSIFTFMD